MDRECGSDGEHMLTSWRMAAVGCEKEMTRSASSQTRERSRIRYNAVIKILGRIPFTTLDLSCEREQTKARKIPGSETNLASKPKVDPRFPRLLDIYA